MKHRPLRSLGIAMVALLTALATGCGLGQQPAGPAGGDDETAAPPAADANWTLEKAAEPYRGTTIRAVFLDRPGYRAAAKMLPEFERRTGIKVEYDTIPYENSHEKQVLDFTSGNPNYDVVLIDVVWIGEFAASGWVAPLDTFWRDPKLADPNLNLDGFFPILLDSFGTWDDRVYGLPFDNYSGLLFYNDCMLKEAGFDGPPKTWQELYEKYGPALTKNGKYAFALQSRRGETQSADSFMRMVWQAGGKLVDEKTFEPQLSSPEALAGLKFRQDLMKYMPPDIVEWDHDETVQGLAQGRVAMITEWSANYATLANPETSKIVDCLKVDVEPAGATGKPVPALGGFSLGVNAKVDEKRQKAAYLFIQWITSEEEAKTYITNGGVSGRKAVYDDPELKEQYPYFEPLVESWEKYGNPVFRPRFPEWPAISEVIAQIGSEMQLGRVSVEEGAKRIDDEVREVLKPYYEDGKPKLQ